MPGQHNFDPEVDYYKVLQVDPRAHPEVIKHAYRALVRGAKAHPDLGGSHQQAVLLNRAYEVLSDPEKRREYDEFRATHHMGGLSSRFGTRPSWGGTSVQPEPDTAQVVICPSCRRKNRLPAQTDPRSARCGICHTPLLGARVVGRAVPRRTPTATPAEERPPVINNHLRLNPALYAELCRDCELKLRSSRRPRGGKCVCRRCNHAWPAPRAGIVTRTCPKCKSQDWNSFRVFKCAQCGYEFTSNSLRTWAYRLFPRCPACQFAKWNLRCERDPLKWLKGLFAGI